MSKDVVFSCDNCKWYDYSESPITYCPKCGRSTEMEHGYKFRLRAAVADLKAAVIVALAPVFDPVIAWLERMLRRVF